MAIIIMMMMIIKGVETANCNPILESRQNRQLQRNIDATSQVLHFWVRKGPQKSKKKVLCHPWDCPFTFLCDLELQRMKAICKKCHLLKAADAMGCTRNKKQEGLQMSSDSWKDQRDINEWWYWSPVTNTGGIVWTCSPFDRFQFHKLLWIGIDGMAVMIKSNSCR